MYYYKFNLAIYQEKYFFLVSAEEPTAEEPTANLESVGTANLESGGAVLSFTTNLFTSTVKGCSDEDLCFDAKFKDPNILMHISTFF